MSRRKQLLWIYLLAMPVVLVMAFLLGALITESATAHATKCQTCHSQKAAAMTEGKFVKVQTSGKTFYEANDDKLVPLEGWSMTSDLPNWNALIDEHPLVLDADE